MSLFLQVFFQGITLCSLVAAPSTLLQAGIPEKKIEKSICFTGKVSANKVRVRARPDLDSPVIRQMNKNDLLVIVGEEGDFWAVTPPSGVKAYIFRSYVLDNCVEVERVNVRLEPHVEAPIIGQLQIGEKVEGVLCSINHKWLEIDPPKTTRFFISKEFISEAGGPEYFSLMEKKKKQSEELINQARFLAQAESNKAFEDMSLQEPIEKLQTILQEYTDFPELINQAKEELALLKNTYLQKKITYLESKQAETGSVSERPILEKQIKELAAEAGEFFDQKISKKTTPFFPHIWDSMEEALFLSWTAFHTGKKKTDFYLEQKANAATLTGKVVAFESSVKNKPGDYILYGPNAPIAYLYSTEVPLDEYEGQIVTLLGSPRSNNHFAFPTYFVHSVE